MDDLISRQDAIDEIDEWIKAFLENGHKESAADACLIQDGIIQLPSAQPSEDTQAAFEQGRIQGHVEMRTELLMQLKEIVGDEVWANI